MLSSDLTEVVRAVSMACGLYEQPYLGTRCELGSIGVIPAPESVVLNHFVSCAALGLAGSRIRWYHHDRVGACPDSGGVWCDGSIYMMAVIKREVYIYGWAKSEGKG